MKDVNEILSRFLNSIQEIFHENLIGIYVTGSLSYGDFSQNNSDIDLVILLKNKVSEKEMRALKKFHERFENDFPKWAKRLECSYIHMNMIHRRKPPKEPRPYFNEGIFYEKAPYGNEWVITQYELWNFSIPLFGPAFNTLIKQIEISDVQKACIDYLFQEWELKVAAYYNKNYFQDGHNQSYAILQMCRILYTVICGKFGSKKEAASWVKNNFAPEWRNLIEAAENWEYGVTIHREEETINFIKFVIKILKDN